MDSEEVKKLLQAIDCIIRDVDKKYDECLVDHFVEYVHSINHNKDSSASILNPTTKCILDRLKSYFDHKAFIMMNQARCYKTLHAIIKDRRFEREEYFNLFLSYLDSFWSTVDSIIINENLSAVTILLSILQELSKSRFGFVWICKVVFEPELKLHKRGRFYHIRTITNLIEFYLTDCNNYHTKNRTESLLKYLIERHILDDCKQEESSLFHDESRNLIRNSIANNSLSMLLIIGQILKDNRGNLQFLESFDINYSATKMVYDRLMETIKLSESNSNELSKCLATINSVYDRKDHQNIFEFLLRKGRIESAMIYLSHLEDDNSKNLKDLQLYSILICISHMVNERVKSKVVNCYRSKTSQAELLMNPKLVTEKLATLSIMNLSRILNSFARQNDELYLIKDVMIGYVNDHYKLSKSFKNVMECCDIIKTCSQLLETNVEDNNSTYLDSITESISKLDLSADRSKLALIKLIGSLRFRHKNYSQIEKLFDLIASQTDNHDVVNEFVEMFISSEIDFKKPDIEQDLNIERCVNLFWNEIYKNVQDTEHLDLMGNLYKVLANLNQQVDCGILRKFGIVQNQTITRLIKEYEPPQESESELEFYNMEGNKMVNSTIVNDIINYELISDGIIDCY